ncbi:MAG: hypothetical protein PHP92_05110 [Candidatus Nanoarchaeia archaeon]|nr:hypothetical protein [Candidatus Nanoarchaeia archaeon]
MKNKVKMIEGQLTIAIFNKLGKQLIMKNENGLFLGRIVFPVSEPVEYKKYNDFDDERINKIENMLINNNLGLTTRLVIAMLEEHGYIKLKKYLENIDKLSEIKTIAQLNSAIRENELD